NYYNENEFFITVTLNEVTTDNYGNYKIGNEYEYGFTSSQRKIIADNGFKEILSDPLTNNYGWTCYDLTQPVTLTVNESIWWDGMRAFAVGFSVGDKEFLSFETGKAKLLHYIEHEMH
ncbi:MAG: hypothetical protein K2O81_06920, partial [Clostridia bacterium]|nr:hypothetical protein [Clostridia bacterium]